jgi:hypothetical protein
MAKDDLKNEGIHNLTSMGQFGYVQLTTASTDITGVKFSTIYANEDSTFTVGTYSVAGAASITVALLKGGHIPGPFINITGLTGNILCAKATEL